MSKKKPKTAPLPPREEHSGREEDQEDETCLLGYEELLQVLTLPEEALFLKRGL